MTRAKQSSISWRFTEDDDARLRAAIRRMEPLGGATASDVVRAALRMAASLSNEHLMGLLDVSLTATTRDSPVGRASVSSADEQLVRELRARCFMLGHELATADLVRRALHLIEPVEDIKFAHFVRNNPVEN